MGIKLHIGNENDYIKANRKGSREAEIELFGHPINYTKVHKNKKVYTRKDKHRGKRFDVYFYELIYKKFLNLNYFSYLCTDKTI